MTEQTQPPRLGFNEGYEASVLSASALLKSGKGLLGGFFVSSVTSTPSLTVYDNTAGSGTKIIDAVTLTAGMSIPAPARFTNGCYVVITGTATLTAFYQ